MLVGHLVSIFTKCQEGGCHDGGEDGLGKPAVDGPPVVLLLSFVHCCQLLVLRIIVPVHHSILATTSVQKNEENLYTIQSDHLAFSTTIVLPIEATVDGDEAGGGEAANQSEVSIEIS